MCSNAKIIGIAFLSVIILFAAERGCCQDINIGAMVQPIPKDYKMINPDYHIWGASVVKGDDNKYHMYYSRWPRELGHFAWVTDSEIAYAVAEKAEGPYQHINVSLPARGKEFWDGTTTHNPTVFKKDGKYYLYYMGTTSPVKAKQPTAMKNKDWWLYRNNQRIGVAVADKPGGPWKRLDKAVLDVSKNPRAYDALMTSNPAVNYTENGKIIMLYKAVDKTENHITINLSTNDSYKLSKGNKVRFMVAFADNPLGPFDKHLEPIFEQPGTEGMHMVAEDPCLWHENGIYYAIVRDNMGVYTGDAGALALLKSTNGYDWDGAENPMVIGSTFEWEDGTQSEYKLERPQILIEDGYPTFLFGALGITVDEVHRGHSCNLRVSLKQPELNFQKLLPEKLDKANIIQEEDYNVWGTNIIKGKDGKYHAIYSRWLKSRGHYGWATHSEIAHAVSDNLTGPYKFKNLVLPPRGNKYWDGDCTHNPHVVEYQGKYYLYHMGNHGSGHWDATPDTLLPKSSEDEWWVNRNNQRIGVAIADDLNGVWKRFDKPLIDISKNKRLVSTPVVSIRPDGKFLMAHKYVVEKEGRFGGQVIHITALADSPTGPFVETKVPFITNSNAQFAIDDHVEWFQNGNYYCIGKDHDGSLTKFPQGSMVLFSADKEGLVWKLAENPLVLKAGELNWTDGSQTICNRTADMPKLYYENGIPKALIIAVLPKNSEVSFSLVIPFNVQIPLKINKD